MSHIRSQDFIRYLRNLLTGFDTPQRIDALIDYGCGLMLEGIPKTLQSLGNALSPDNPEGMRQQMQRAIQKGRFDADELLSRFRQAVFTSQTCPKLKHYIIDDTGIPKKGKLSVGVARQYSGTLGRIGNCQVVTTLHAAADAWSIPLAGRVYLSKDWINDHERRELCQIPGHLRYQSKIQIALAMLKDTLAQGGPRLPILADAGYGNDFVLRQELRTLGLEYALGVHDMLLCWHAQTEVKLNRTRYENPDGIKPKTLRDWSQHLESQNAFEEIEWRDGSKGEKLKGDFAFLPIRTQGSKEQRRLLHPVELLVIERTDMKNRPYKYFLCTKPKTFNKKKLVHRIKSRWHIERDYQNMKQNLGFDTYEGRSWGGTHRHLAMVMLVYSFLATQFEDFSPS